MQALELIKRASALMHDKRYSEAFHVLAEVINYKLGKDILSEIYFHMGLCLYHQGNFVEAAEHFETSCALNMGAPSDKRHIHDMLLLSYRGFSDFEKLAETCLLILEYSDDLVILQELSFAYRKNKKWEETLEILNRIRKEDIRLCDMQAKLKCFSMLLLVDEACIIAKEYIALYGEDGFLCRAMGWLYANLCDIPKALEYYKKAIDKSNDAADRFSSYGVILSRNLYSELLTEEEYIRCIEAMRRNSETLEKNRNFKNLLKPFKKLKLGYLSANLCPHPIGYFLSPVIINTIESHSHIKCYSLLPYNDRDNEVTAMFMNTANEWADVYDKTDDEIERMFLDDGIDIAFDMMCHTSGNRLGLHARRLSPIQISWISFPVTTAVNAMDYVLTDRAVDPPGIVEKYYTEKLLYMPDTFLCYILQNDHKPMPPVFDHNGYITFGCFHNTEKLSDKTLRMWRQILDKVENSRMIIMGKMPSREEAIEHVLLRRFKLIGLPMERITLVPMRKINDYMQSYGDVDIMLDTYPFNGATTTFDAFTMGRPIITLSGETHVTRVGRSMLRHVGLEELAAYTEDEYIEKAVALANDPERLRRICSELPERVNNSALTDQFAFRKNYEKVIRDAWVTHCFEKRIEPYNYDNDDFGELLQQAVNAYIYMERKLEAGECIAWLMPEYHAVQAALLEKLRPLTTDSEFVNEYERLINLTNVEVSEDVARAVLDISKRFLTAIYGQ